jgi:hypothetical protein
MLNTTNFCWWFFYFVIDRFKTCVILKEVKQHNTQYEQNEFEIDNRI